jgi:pimeloyl-ACP methyl ester carboxylesterase
MPYFIHNKHQLFYREAGHGPLLLLLPGNTASSAAYVGELDYFSRRYHTVALDFRGTGQSERLTVWPDDWWQQGAHDAAALVAHLGYEHCIALGSSGGAVVALLLAIHHPEKVHAVIADSTVERLPPQRVQAILAERRHHLPALAAFWQQAHGDDWEQVINADSDLMGRFAGQGIDWLGGQMHAVCCPVLFTASLRDAALPDVDTQVCGMATSVADGRVFFTNVGDHPLIWSRPDDFRRAADCFLDALT